MVYFQCFKHVLLFLPVFFFYEYTHRVCVYKWAYCWIKQQKSLPTYLPYFSVPRYANTTIYFWGPKSQIEHSGSTVAYRIALSTSNQRVGGSIPASSPVRKPLDLGILSTTASVD